MRLRWPRFDEKPHNFDVSLNGYTVSQIYQAHMHRPSRAHSFASSPSSLPSSNSTMPHLIHPRRRKLLHIPPLAQPVINEYGAVFPKLNFSSPKARLGQAIIPPSFIEWKKELLERRTRPGSCRRHPH